MATRVLMVFDLPYAVKPGYDFAKEFADLLDAKAVGIRSPEDAVVAGVPQDEVLQHPRIGRQAGQAPVVGGGIVLDEVEDPPRRAVRPLIEP